MRCFFICGIMLICAPEVSWAPPPSAELAPKKEMEIEGHYSFERVPYDGKSYKGVVTIERQQGFYTVVWTSAGKPPISGIGLLDEERRILAVSWIVLIKEGMVANGVSHLRVEAGPRLVGRWAMLSNRGEERLEFLKNGPPAE